MRRIGLCVLLLLFSSPIFAQQVDEQGEDPLKFQAGGVQGQLGTEQPGGLIEPEAIRSTTDPTNVYSSQSQYGEHKIRVLVPSPRLITSTPHLLVFKVTEDFRIGGVTSNDPEIVYVPKTAFAATDAISQSGDARTFEREVILRRPGTTTLNIEVRQDARRINVPVVVVLGAVDLQLPNLPEEQEETVGGTVYETEVVPVDLSFPQAPDAYATLRALEFTVETGGEKIALWYDQKRTRPIQAELRGPGSYRVWFRTPAETPATIWIEGKTLSDAERDVRFHFGPLNWGEAPADEFAGDSATLTVRPAGELILSPILIAALSNQTVKQEQTQLSVTFVRADGTQSPPLEADPGTTYEWIVAPGAGDPVMAQVYDQAIAALQKYIPGIGLATIDVDSNGVLTVSSPGINLVQAVRGSKRSNMAIVVAGLRAKELILAPGYLPTNIVNGWFKAKATVREMVGAGADIIGVPRASFADGKKEAKMIVLQPDVVAHVGDKDTIRVKDVVFEFLAEGEDSPTISLTELLEVGRTILPAVLGNKITKLSGIFKIPNMYTTTISYLLEKGIFAWIESMVEYSVADEEVVKVTTVREGIAEKFSELSGIPAGTISWVMNAGNYFGLKLPSLLDIRYVQSGVPGLTTVKGKLDLGRLGAVEDTVPVLVMPNIERVTIVSDLDVDNDHSPPIVLSADGTATPALLTAVAEGKVAKEWRATLKPADAALLAALIVGAKKLDIQLEGTIEVVKVTPDGVTLSAKNIRALWRVLNLTPGALTPDFLARAASGAWTFEGQELPKSGTDACFATGGHDLTAIRVHCLGNRPLLFDPLIEAQSIEQEGEAVVTVSITVPVAGCPPLGADPARCSTRRIVKILPTSTTCRVEAPVILYGENGGPGGPRLGELDRGRFQSSPYVDLLLQARDAYPILRNLNPGVVRPGAHAGPKAFPEKGLWQGAWVYFVEFPVANPGDCQLVVERSFAKGIDELPTVGTRQNFGSGSNNQSYPLQRTAKYRDAQGSATDAIVFMGAIVVTAPTDFNYALHQMTEKLVIWSKRKPEPRAAIDQAMQAALVMRDGAPEFRVQVVESGYIDPDSSGRSPPFDVVGRFRDLGVPFVEHR